MKITALLIFVGIFQVSAESYAQRISLSENGATIQKLFAQIKNQTGYSFVYDGRLIKKAKPIDINVKDVLLTEALDLCFSQQYFTYKILNNTIIVQEKSEVFEDLKDEELREKQIQRQISGQVVDGVGKPLVGVSIIVKGTNTGTSTDGNGNYSIAVPGSGTLVFSSLGFINQEVLVGDKTVVNVRLVEQPTALNEIVITALGIRKQAKSLGYSTTEIPGSNLTESRTPNLANALSGQVAGVSVAGTGTGPTGSTRITIRGNSSLTGGGTPLYIIDGVPFESENQGSSGKWGGADYGDALSMINPDDIESINVLKGVAASALYGYRGGNGVILITTKSGARSNGVSIEVNNNTTLNTIIDERDFQYVYGQGDNGVKPTTIEDAQNTVTSSWGDKLDGSNYTNFLGNTIPYVGHKDNLENFYRTGISNQTTVSLSGGGANGNFRLGVSNMNMSEVIPKAGMEQQGVNFKSDYDLTERIHLSFAASYMFENVKNRPWFSDSPGSVVASTTYLASSFDIRDLAPGVQSNGDELLPNASNVWFNNPYFVTNYFKNSTDRNRYTGNIILKYDLADWISVQGQVSRNSFLNDQSTTIPYGTGWEHSGSLSVSSSNSRELNAGFMFDINKNLGDAFSLHANLGGNHQDNLFKASSTSGGLDLPYWYSVNNIVSHPYRVGFSQYRVNSFFGSADFGFKDFLFLTLTARNDWFSTLNPETNSILYPSISSSFVFSDAFDMPDWITSGKLRASYAQSSAGTGPYRNALSYSNLNINYGGLIFSNISQGTVPNAFLKPLSIKETEVGLSMSFLNNRLSIDAAVYNKNTENDILNVSVSSTSGYDAAIQNIGKLRNRGLELLVRGTPIQTTNFSWRPSFNIAFNDSKVLFLSPGVSNLQLGDGDPARYGTFSIQQIVGEQYGQLIGYKYLRDDKGNKVYGKDGLPLRTDLTSLGSGVYRTTGGFGNDFKYKGFTVSALLDFKFGAKIYSVTNADLYSRGLHKETLKGRVEGYTGPGVTEDGQPNTVSVDGQTYWTSLGGEGAVNDIAEEFVYDASFIKLRNISLGYTFPASFLGKTPIKALTFSIVGRNVATLLKHTPNIDPESNLTSGIQQGVEYNGFPAVRNIGFNLNIKF